MLTRIRNLIESRQRMKQFFGDRQTLAKEDICDMDKDFVERFKSLIEVKMGDSELNVEDLGQGDGIEPGSALSEDQVAHELRSQ